MDNPNDFNRSLGRLEGKVDSIMKNVAELNANFSQLEQGRLSHVELEVANLKGKVAIYAAVISFFTSIALILINFYVQRS